MQNASRTSRTGNLVRWTFPAVLAFLVWSLATAVCAADPTKIEPWRVRGLGFEKRGAWLEACRCYEDALRKERNNPAAREGYQRSLRRLHLSNRHADSAYRQSLARLNPAQAMEVYEQVLSILRIAYPDRSRTNWQPMFRQGLQELRLALDEPLFRRHHLAGVKPAAINAFKKRLETWSARVTTLSEAREQALLAVRSASKDGFVLRPALLSTFTLELAAGACNTLDDFSSFLTPASMSTVKAALKGKLLGVGVELGVKDGLVITRVYPKSPAFEAGLQPGDRLLKIAGHSVEDLPADAAAERLRGPAKSSVDVEIAGVRKPIRLVRRAFPIASIEYRLNDNSAMMGGYPFQTGYLRIHQFQDSTFQEIKDALAAMTGTGDPIKGLVLDLRGNPGGVFKSAVAIAELFLGDGIIVVGQSPIKEFNRTFKAENPGAAQMPIVVLIDGETASSAEVLAGALKESRPARAPTLLVGQTTFGKGSIQFIIPMDKSPLDRLTGIRLTVARLLSPSSQPVTGRGIAPDQVSDLEGDALINAAKARLQQFITEALTPRAAVVMGPAS